MRSIQVSLVLAACLLAMPLVASGEDQTVEISHHQLSPAEISIQVGESVTFVNRVEMPGGHSIVADDGSFTSPQLDKNQSWSQLFERAGTFTYHVNEHPDVKGVINVKESSTLKSHQR